jgi:hypothetical protein
VTDSDDRSTKDDGKEVYLPPPPSAEEGPTEEVRVPRVNPPSPALSAFVRDRSAQAPAGPAKKAPNDAWVVVVALIALAAGLAYLFR